MIRIKFIRWENVVLMKILEMDEKYRCVKGDGFKDDLTIYQEPALHKDKFTKIKIMSCARPEVDFTNFDNEEIVLHLYLRGYQKAKDDKIYCFECEDDYTAKIVVEELEYAIRKINEKDENKDDIDIKIAE